MFTCNLSLCRLISIPGPSVYLSPVGNFDLEEDFSVTYKVPINIDVPSDSHVNLVYWHPGMFIRCVVTVFYSV